MLILNFLLLNFENQYLFIMLELNFDKVPGFSKLFCDFLNKESFFSERFIYLEDLEQNNKLLEKKLNTYSKRKLFKKIVEESNKTLSLSQTQQKNLKLLEKDNTLVVTTGQQPGIFGGPLYTFYKTFTTIQIANILSNHFKDYNFIPLFWIEDNDHDCIEVFQSVLLNERNEIVEIPIEEHCIKNWKNSLSEYTLSTIYFNFLDFFFSTNKSFEENSDLANFLLQLFQNEVSLVATFQSLFNKLFNEYGVLFIKASVCRKNLGFEDILWREFEKIGASFSIINTTNHLIQSLGYHIQAKNSLPNVFFHSQEKRVKVEWNVDNHIFVLEDLDIPENEILSFYENNRDKFSPNVLLRPICQDNLLPNIVSVLGPSEIGYTTQLKELYEWFSVAMPAISPRHSISFIPREYEENFRTKGFDFFVRPKEEIENELYSISREAKLVEEIEKIEKDFEDIFQKLKHIGTSLDKSLSLSAEAHFSKSYKQLKSFINKIFSAEKRIIFQKNKEVFNINNFLYPKGTLQERMLTTIYPLIKFGDSEFSEIISQIAELPPAKHYLIFL